MSAPAAPSQVAHGRRLTDGERVLLRAQSLMANGKARSWSHAIDIAAQTLKRDK